MSAEVFDVDHAGVEAARLPVASAERVSLRRFLRRWPPDIGQHDATESCNQCWVPNGDPSAGPDYNLMPEKFCPYVKKEPKQ
jgi:hypothetical protein